MPEKAYRSVALASRLKSPLAPFTTVPKLSELEEASASVVMVSTEPEVAEK
jgi:hypothetical protein